MGCAMWTTSKTTTRIASVLKNSDAINKAGEAMGKAGAALGSAFNDVFKDFDKHFEDTDEETSRIESDKMVVDVSGTELVVKGELTKVKLNGKVIWEAEPG